MLAYSLRYAALLLLYTGLAFAQSSEAQAALNRAMQMADLYNWADAVSEFETAERLFKASGDERNAMFARLGRLRANVERQQRSLHEISAELDIALASDPLLISDKYLRMFCLIIKGDIDTEINTRAMKEDWEEVQRLAHELGDAKWQYRASAQLGLAAFYGGDLDTARKNVGNAVAAAKRAGDVGAQIRYITVLGKGLVASRMHQQALPFFENSLEMASAYPLSGYPFLTNSAKLEALIGLGRYDAAERLGHELLAQAEKHRRPLQQAIVLSLLAQIARAQHKEEQAISAIRQSMALAETGGATRVLAENQAQLAHIYRTKGDLAEAEHFASLAASSTQASGNVWAVPQRLLSVAEIMISRGNFTPANKVFERAEAFVDALIGKMTSVLEKTAVVKASSDIYAKHFSLVAGHFRNPEQAYSIIEQVRGRVSTDILSLGSVASEKAKQTERAISRLRLKLIAARSTSDVRSIRDELFLLEQSRWVSPGVSVLKRESGTTVPLRDVQGRLSASTLILEYVLLEPQSYCLVISRGDSRLITLSGRSSIESLITEYLTAVRAKRRAFEEARRLYDALLAPIRGVSGKENIIIVRDGQLHLLPFGALVDPRGRYLIATSTVAYVPSASSFYLLARNGGRRVRPPAPILSIGGVPYDQSGLKPADLDRDYGKSVLLNIPGSMDEVKGADAALRHRRNALLTGRAATESAFKRAPLSDYHTIHMAVHGLANVITPDRAALVLLSDPASAEDGFLQLSEVVQLPLRADLVVLSACDTAVGALHGQEGVANLSRAFLLAGAQSVVSTLWSLDDRLSLFLMKRFYEHLSKSRSAAYSLGQAQRDLLHTFGAKAVPYYWAGFIIEGVSKRSTVFHSDATRQ